MPTRAPRPSPKAPGLSSHVASALFCFALACGTEPRVRDAGDVEPEAGVDASSPDVAPPFDAGLEPLDLGLREDAAPKDATVEPDAAPLVLDAGSARPGRACESAEPWVIPRGPLVGTTTSSEHRDHATCTGGVSGATAPEVWWTTRLNQPQHLVVRLGTAGWDGVVAVRTATCARGAETCADAPAILELPVALGRLYFTVDGFSTGAGAYALAGTLGPPLDVPPANADCTAAEPLVSPAAVGGHDFGGVSWPVEGCALEDAVFYTVDVPEGHVLSLRAEPQAGQDLGLAVATACDGVVLACGDAGGRGHAEALMLADRSGLVVVAVGARGARPTPGSFVLSASSSAQCLSDVDCALGARCAPSLECVPGGAFTVTSTIVRPIPDGLGAIEVPLTLDGPAARPARVRVRVAIDHPYPEDLVVELFAPDVEGLGSIHVRLRDRSGAPAETVFGPDRPAEGPGSLDDFLLVPSATGTWRLRVEDRAPGDHGSLLGVALDVESE